MHTYTLQKGLPYNLYNLSMNNINLPHWTVDNEQLWIYGAISQPWKVHKLTGWHCVMASAYIVTI